jgi:uncharacterized protein (DUF2141 family)
VETILETKSGSLTWSSTAAAILAFHALNRLRRIMLRFCLTILAGVLFYAAPATAQNQPAISISGSVIGASGKNAVYVALWDETGFLKKPVQEIRIAAGAEAIFHFQVPHGKYALSAFEDKNGNGVLDMGAFGPKEPSGFWRAFHAWHKPRFPDVASSYAKDSSGIQIQLH